MCERQRNELGPSNYGNVRACTCEHIMKEKDVEDEQQQRQNRM